MSTLELTCNLLSTLSENQLKQVFNFAKFIKSDGIGIPNDDTLEAIKEVEIMKKNPSAYKGYNNVKEMFEDILD